jgi:ribosome-binding protein aMBF1 (putative translation factor)
VQTAVVTTAVSRRKYQELRRLLVDARERAGVPQVALARKLGRPQSFVSKVEIGERRLDLIEFLDVPRALDVDPINIIRNLERS